MTEKLVRSNERVDDLQNGYFVIQDPEKFCFGMDAVLLAGFCRIRKGEQVLDLGTGTGIIPILLAAKSEGERFIGLEIQQECQDMALRSVRYNGLEEKVNILCGDIREAGKLFGPASFDVVTCNPPYMTEDHGIPNPDPAKAVARHEILCTLEDMARESSLLLKDKGRLYLVHRPFRLAEIILMLTRYRLEPKRMQLVYPYVDRGPNLVLIEARKNGNSRLEIEKPLIVYGKPGVYTQDILEIYGMGDHEK